ncbi:Inner membrane protein YnbA [compost metagenome]
MAGVILLAIFTEYAGVLGLMVGASRRYDGPMGKSDRAFCLGLLGIAVALGWVTSVWIEGVLLVLCALLLYTLFNRVRQGLAEGAGNSHQ